MNITSSTKREIWEEESFTLDDSRDSVAPGNLTLEHAPIEPSNEELKEELKAQESTANIFAPNGLEDGDPEMVTDSATMSELDEINPPDAMSYNHHFFEAAHEFLQTVEYSGEEAPKKGRAFMEHIQNCFINVRNAS